MNGFLEFSDGPRTDQQKVVFPNPHWPDDNDPSFIGIFYTKARIGELDRNDYDRRRPGVYFR